MNAVNLTFGTGLRVFWSFPNVLPVVVVIN